MEELKKKFRSLRRAYFSLKKKSEENVVRWEWAAAPLYDPRPFWFERSMVKRGQKLTEKPRKIDGACEYGYDAEGRVVVVREGTSIRGAFYEEFLRYGSCVVEGVLFDYGADKEPLNVTRQSYEGVQLTMFELLGQNGYTKETYDYKGGKVTRIRVDGIDFDDDEPESVRTYYIQYDDSGDATAIDLVYENGEREVLWKVRKMLKAPHATDHLAEKARSGLTRQVPRKVAALGLSEPIYCVVLAYDTGAEEILPPLLGVGLASEREIWTRERRSRLKHLLWNPAEFKYFDTPELEFDDKRLLEACERLNELYPDAWSLDQARQLLNATAAELMQLDWSSVCPITPDFVVFAADLEESDYEENLKASVPEALVRQLRSRRWL